MSIRVLVCGGRDYDDRERVFAVLDKLDKERDISAVIDGGATGADLFGFAWACSLDKIRHTFKADWATHGKKAGPLRNQRMLDEGKPDVVVVFPGGKGTADMRARAEKAGVPVLVVD